MIKMQEPKIHSGNREFKSFKIFYDQVKRYHKCIALLEYGGVNDNLCVMLIKDRYTVTSNRDVFSVLHRAGCRVAFVIPMKNDWKSVYQDVFNSCSLIFNMIYDDEVDLVKCKSYFFDDRTYMTNSDPEFVNHVIGMGHHKFKDSSRVSEGR